MINNEEYYTIGLDIGNSTTKAILLKKNYGNYKYLDSHIINTTGIKGTIENFIGCEELLNIIISRNNLSNKNINIKINHAAPVISDLSIDVISETKIIDSAMIGHNPDTPGGIGIAYGQLLWIHDFIKNKIMIDKKKQYILIFDDNYHFNKIVSLVNNIINENFNICGLIIKNDDAVLISNRLLKKSIPILDEVIEIHKLSSGNMAAIEVVEEYNNLKILSDPYEIATLFKLNAKETKDCILISKNFIGKRSGVIIKTTNSKFVFNKIKAGHLNIYDISKKIFTVDINSGSKKIMNILGKCNKVIDVTGEQNTNSQFLIDKIKNTMAFLTNDSINNMKISDILAIDTFKTTNVLGSLAGENIMEQAVIVAAQVQTSRLSIEAIAEKIKKIFSIECSVYGYEADMAIRGALTTPGTEKPLAILDLGGGSTDAAIIDENNNVNMIHCAGAGEMVTKIIDLELNLKNIKLAELIKCFPLAKATGVLKLRYENNNIKFLKSPLPVECFSKIVILKNGEYIPIKNINKTYTLEKIINIRRKAKKKVFFINAFRALQKIAPKNDLTNIKSIVLVGGSSQDFEIYDILCNGLDDYKITLGKAKLLGILPSYYAVALGLAIS